MSDDEFLVCPACGRTEPATERTPCPACGSDRAYLSPEPALPDATSEAYVKLDADEAAGGSDAEHEAAGSVADVSALEEDEDDAADSDADG